MVGTVCKGTGTIEGSKEGIRLYAGGMQFVAIVPCVAAGFFDMLDDSASKAYVDDLHTFTDAENRAFPRKEKFQCLKLEDIQLHVDVFGALVFLPEKCGGDIAAARQEKPVKPCQSSGIHGGKEIRAHGTQGIFIVGGIPASSDDGNFWGRGIGGLHSMGFLSLLFVWYFYCMRMGKECLKNP